MLKTFLRYLIIGLFLLGLLLPYFAMAQQLEEDPALKARRKPPVKEKPLVLRGNVTTLDDAIVQEKETVNWYGWYLSCRQYLGENGGLSCPLGTMIRFNKNGVTQAMSQDPACIISAAQKYFPLPPNTKLTAILLPVRSGQKPPASPQELLQQIRNNP